MSHPADYLVFAPGQLVGRHVGWAAGSDQLIERLAAKARATTKASERRTIYRRFQIALNQRGPYFPLFQPTQVFVSTTDRRTPSSTPCT